MRSDPRWVDAPARVLMAALFLISGIGKLAAVAGTQAFMESYGVPGLLVWPAAAFEIGSAVVLVAGVGLRPLALLLSGWCLLTAAIFHTKFGDPVQMVMFLKNLTMAGGFLILARAGAPGLGLSGFKARRSAIERHRPVP